MILSDSTIIIALIAIFFGGVSRGFIGFGAALIIVPALVFGFGASPAVALMSLIEVPGTLQLARTAARQADWRSLLPLYIAAAATIPLGAWAHVISDPEIVRRGIGLLVVLFAILIVSGWRYNGQISQFKISILGLVSGFCSGVANLGGPPVVMFLIAKGSNAAQTRAGIIAYFALTTVIRLGAFSLIGLYNVELLFMSLIFAPLYMAGIWVGSKYFNYVTELFFRRVVVTLILIIGILTIVK